MHRPAACSSSWGPRQKRQHPPATAAKRRRPAAHPYSIQSPKHSMAALKLAYTCWQGGESTGMAAEGVMWCGVLRVHGRLRQPHATSGGRGESWREQKRRFPVLTTAHACFARQRWQRAAAPHPPFHTAPCTLTLARLGVTGLGADVIFPRSCVAFELGTHVGLPAVVTDVGVGYEKGAKDCAREGWGHEVMTNMLCTAGRRMHTKQGMGPTCCNCRK